MNSAKYESSVPTGHCCQHNHTESPLVGMQCIQIENLWCMCTPFLNYICEAVEKHCLSACIHIRSIFMFADTVLSHGFLHHAKAQLCQVQADVKNPTAASQVFCFCFLSKNVNNNKQ